MAMNRRFELILVVLIVIGAAYYTRAEYIPPFSERHVEVAEEKYALDVGDPGPWFSAWSVGDGQAFAVIAADPTGMKLSAEIKEPAYRFTRAGFGWLAAVASFGRESWIPYGMAVIGVLSLAGLVIFAISVREQLGPRIWLLLVNPAIYLGFAGDTAEPLALLLLTAAVFSGSVWAALALGVTRPSYLVALIGRWRELSFGLAATAAILVYGLIRFGADQFVPDGGRIGLPFSAFVEHSTFLGWMLVAIAVGTLGVGLKRRDWAWVVSGVLVICLGSDVIADPINAWRAAGMIPVLWAFGPGYQAVQAASSRNAVPTSMPLGK